MVSLARQRETMMDAQFEHDRKMIETLSARCADLEERVEKYQRMVLEHIDDLDEIGDRL